MNESKIVVTERLRREGRWAEASKFKDAAAANVPSVLQQRVSETLNDWARRYAVSLESEALAQLDSGICRLIKDSLGAFSQQ